LITGCATTLGPITTGGVTITVGPTTGPVTNVTVGGVGPTTTGLGTVPLGPTTNCGVVGVWGCGPTVNGTGNSAMAFADNFTTCGVDVSVILPPPHAVNAVNTNSDIIFFMLSFLELIKSCKSQRYLSLIVTSVDIMILVVTIYICNTVVIFW
jgi:hypothetical protein